MKHNLNKLGRSTAILLSVLFVSCRPPEEPAALKSSANSTVKCEAPASLSLTEEFFPGGAKVGDAETLKEIANCHKEKKFYSRSLGECTSYKLANVGCSEEKLAGSMTQKNYDSFKKVVAEKLPGYLVDQCIDCSAPTAQQITDKLCTADKKGFNIFFVKETKTEDGKNGILSQTIFSRFLAENEKSALNTTVPKSDSSAPPKKECAPNP